MDRTVLDANFEKSGGGDTHLHDSSLVGSNSTGGIIITGGEGNGNGNHGPCKSPCFPSTALLFPDTLESKDHIEELIKSQCRDGELSGCMNSNQSIMQAVKNGTVTESMIAMAASKFPKELYFLVVESYAKTLVAKGENLKAMNYFILIGQHEKAIRILIEKKSFHHAIVLGKLLLDPRSELMEEIYEKAVAYFLRIGSYSVATKILCSIGKYGEALASIESLNQKYTLETAVYLAGKIGDEVKTLELQKRLETTVAMEGSD